MQTTLATLKHLAAIYKKIPFEEFFFVGTLDIKALAIFKFRNRRNPGFLFYAPWRQEFALKNLTDIVITKFVIRSRIAVVKIEQIDGFFFFIFT